ncbi:hypothetical protein BKA62DRAFT_620213 [Auriculariales sp. MPI-PUGE-AT-0066]|nr:hypothetical protein BKA62DRAFT_620213 [Auriculariales sp. MPI-PUGE-AT-0066]
MPDATAESRKRSRSPSAEADVTVADKHHHKRLNVGTDADHPRVEPVAAPSVGTEDTLMESADGTGVAVTDVAMPDASGDAAGKDSNFKQMVHMRCLIMTQDASVIIGKGGAHIAEIRKKSGARVLVSEAVPGNPERILNISGQLEAVAKAFGLIARRMNDEPFDTTSGPNSRAVTIRLAIPHQRMGSVIGKGGVKIKEIQDQSGAQLKASEGVLPNSTERILNIVGVADAIHIATYHVGNVLLEAQKIHGATNNALYPGFPQQQQQRPPYMNGPVAPVGYPMGQQQPNMQFGGNPMGAMGVAGGAVAPVTQEVSVPADLIGTIIGKGGAKINELRQVSASNIKVLDPSPGAAGTNQPRRVTISGAPANVQMAVSLLNQRLQFERQKQMRNNVVHA